MLETGTTVYRLKKQHRLFLIIISVLRGWAVLKNYNTKCNFNLQLTLFGLNRL
jgi:hypothetical protein